MSTRHRCLLKGASRPIGASLTGLLLKFPPVLGLQEPRGPLALPARRELARPVRREPGLPARRGLLAERARMVPRARREPRGAALLDPLGLRDLGVRTARRESRERPGQRARGPPERQARLAHPAWTARRVLRAMSARKGRLALLERRARPALAAATRERRVLRVRRARLVSLGRRVLAPRGRLARRGRQARRG
jgi:hypothetical protein